MYPTDDLLSNIALGKIWDTEASIRRCLRPIHVARWCSTPPLMEPIIINCKRWNTPLHGKIGFLIAMGGDCFWAKLSIVFNFGTNVVWMLTGSLLKLLFERVGAVVWGALILPLITLSLQQLQGEHSSTNHAQLQLHIITPSVCFDSTTVLFFSLWFDCPWSMRRGVRSDAQLSCTETRFQKCSQSGKNGSKHPILSISMAYNVISCKKSRKNTQKLKIADFTM